MWSTAGFSFCERENWRSGTWCTNYWWYRNRRSAPKGLMVPVIRNAESMSLCSNRTQRNGSGRKSERRKITNWWNDRRNIYDHQRRSFGSMLSTPLSILPKARFWVCHIARASGSKSMAKWKFARSCMSLCLTITALSMDANQLASLVKVKQMGWEEPVKMFLLREKDPVQTFVWIMRCFCLGVSWPLYVAGIRKKWYFHQVVILFMRRVFLLPCSGKS